MPDPNLADAVSRAATARPNDPAIVYAGSSARAGDEVVTWLEFDGWVDRVAAGLRALRLPGSRGVAARVMVVLPNVPEFAYAYFGILRAGLVAVPVNHGLTPRELGHVLRDSEASAVIAHPDAAAAIEAIRADLPDLRHCFAVGTGSAEGAGRGGGAESLVERLHAAVGAGADAAADEGPVAGEDQLAALLYTSGSSGVPRAAMLTHAALMANLRQLESVDGGVIRRDDVVLLALPLSHVFGLNAGLGAVAWHGACGVLVAEFDPAASLDVIARTGVSVVAGVPQMYAAWAARPEARERFGSVRLAVSGAAPLEVATAEAFRAATGREIYEGYGLTEAAPVVCSALVSPALKVGSVGRPLPGQRLRLLGEDGTVVAELAATGLLHVDAYPSGFDDDAGGVPGTDPGEVAVRGPNLFSGYWPDGRDGPDGDGWWRTGDLGYADADGDLFLVGRTRDMIIVSGFNVYPEEVELVLTGHAGVAQAAAVGIPDPRTGQAVKAYVVRDPGSTVTETELSEHCRRNLARFKCPTSYEFVDALPHTPIGKVRRGVLRPDETPGADRSGLPSAEGRGSR